ncbi:MAG: hypothetical protein F4Z04_00545 [Acidobacteria bacterium]|nr:hypothetical protein [Acidobacteriota bacterium]MYD71269.1 hypothetical protein [Acidobacteriota bacterium]
MSLRSIHLVFIVASILLAALMTWWSVAMFTTGRGGSGYLLFAGGSLAAVIGMSVYAVLFVRKTRAIGMR